MWMFLAIAALAGPPSVAVQSDGSVIGTAELDVSAEVIRANLSDPLWLPTVDGGGTVVVVEGTEGPCLRLKSTSPSSVMTVKYRTKRCPTSTGFRSTLIDSNAFKSYTTSWVFKDIGNGKSTATYTIMANSSLWVPEGIVRRQTRLGIERMLTNVQAWSVTQGQK
ncbi:MAG: hypothetical protein AB8H79_21620 [Myxococcota bacterium]